MTIPPAAVEAAAEAIDAILWEDGLANGEDLAQAALTAALPHMAGWRPISEAPTDERTWVLVFSTTDGVQKAHYASDFDQWHVMQTAEYDNEWRVVENATHWMPLPTAPEEPT